MDTFLVLSKIFQQLLEFDSEIWYIQSLIVMSCIVYKKKSHILLISPFICSFFFSPMKISITDFSAPIGGSVFKFCVHLQVDKV